MKTKKIIIDKNELILIPRWLCISFIQLLRKHCSPVLNVSSSVKIAIVFHQYGFPQNMDEVMDYCDRKKITVIEDCAHVFEGYYGGKRLGTFGLASIFSFSKLFPSVWGGGLWTQNKELYEYSRKNQGLIHSKWISVLLHMANYKVIINRKNARAFWKNLNEMAYGCAEYAQKMNFLSAKIISRELAKNALEKRRENYEFLLNYFKNTEYFNGLEKKGVSPYVVPLIAKEAILHKMRDALIRKNVYTDIYNFDINRNLFNPLYKKCIWIPVHQGLNIEKMTEISEIIEIAT
nr:DegT/DnrJ/EryC1/StrS aminotransferase family protein [Bacteroidota bacterium]